MEKCDNEIIEISNSCLYVMIMSLARFSIMRHKWWSFW